MKWAVSIAFAAICRREDGPASGEAGGQPFSRTYFASSSSGMSTNSG